MHTPIPVNKGKWVLVLKQIFRLTNTYQVDYVHLVSVGKCPLSYGRLGFSSMEWGIFKQYFPSSCITTIWEETFFNAPRKRWIAT